MSATAAGVVLLAVFVPVWSINIYRRRVLRRKPVIGPQWLVIFAIVLGVINLVAK